MDQNQVKLNKLLNRVSFQEIIRFLFAKTSAEAKEIWRVILAQIYFTFNQAIFLLIVIAVLVGISVSMQVGLGLSIIGATSRIGELWAWIVFRIFAPLLAAILIIARSCTAVATETAVMKYTREIEALELMGISPVDYVFTPRIIAGAISNFCMGFLFVIVAFFATWVSKNWFSSMPVSYLFDQISKALLLEDIVFFILKTTIVGAGIFWIASKKGLMLLKASFEVPIIAMHAVVDSFIWAIVTHGFFTTIYILRNGFHL